MHGAKEGGREGYKERVRESEGSINGPSISWRVGLTLKLDELLWPSMPFEVILTLMKFFAYT